MCLFCDCFLNILLQLLYHVFQKLIRVFAEMDWIYRLIFSFNVLGECMGMGLEFSAISI